MTQIGPSDIKRSSQSKLPMETQLTAGFGLLLGFAVGLFVASFTITSKSIDAEMAVNQRHVAMQEIKTARGLMDRAEALARSYIINPDDQYINLFNYVVLSIPNHMHSVSGADPDADREGHVSQLTEALNKQTARLQAVMQIRHQESFERAKQELLKYENMPERNFATTIFEKLEGDQKRLLDMQLAESAKTFSNAMSFFILLSVLVFAGFFWLVHKMYSGIIYQKKIEEALDKRAQELTSLNERLVESERIKGEFVATVSHELRTPLTLILAPLETLLSKSESLTPVQRSHLQTMHNNTVRLLQLISGLLEFSKLEAGQVEVKLEPTAIVTLTQSVLSDFQPAIDGKNLKLSADMPDPSLLVQMDRYLYERILFNLVSNAVKFTPENGEIKVTLTLRNERATLIVEDSGIGIPKDDLEVIFQKFRQVEAPSTRRFEGTGLGLALVSEFARMLDGNVTVESQENKGSKFTVELKATPAKEVEVEPAELREKKPLIPQFTPRIEAEATAGATVLPRVLVAEDNSELATYISSVLSEFSNVRIARDGMEAWDTAVEWAPDLILTDVMMPRLDGLALTKKIKSDRKLANTSVVLLTALTNREALLKGWEAGADEYLFKPFHPKELTIRVGSILKGVAERKRAEELALKEQKMEQTKDFMSTLAHDMQVPLLGASRVFDMLVKGQLGEMPEEIVELINQIQEKNRWLLHLTENLLEIYSYEAGTKDLIYSDVQVPKIISGTIEGLSERARTVKVNLVADVEEKLPSVRGDSQALANLLGQLLDNALKFTPEGGTVTVAAANGNDTISISVSNSGSYMQPDEIARLFDRFWRGQPGRKFVQNTGLGLYLCKRIVEAHRGQINCNSDEKEGTTFKVTLPVS